MTPTEPACWSWPMPPLRVLADELAAVAAAMSGLPLDDRLPASALTLIYPNPQTLRWVEFHTGVRAADSWDAPVRCAICGYSRGRMVDDHDHRSGLVRGILCSGCNTSEGLAGTDAAMDYRERNPASILDHRAYYTGGYGWKIGWWKNLAYARRLTGNPAWEPVEGAAW